LPGDDVLRLSDFRARLVHVCEGHSLPSPGLINLLSAEAVIMGLNFLGMVRLTEIPDGDSEAGDEIPF
jgi:hypothetical protein